MKFFFKFDPYIMFHCIDLTLLIDSSCEYLSRVNTSCEYLSMYSLSNLMDVPLYSLTEFEKACP